jgi:hypothetical protein
MRQSSATSFADGRRGVTADTSTSEIAAGQRSRLSKLGVERCPRLKGRVGVVKRIRENSKSIVVRFDGNKTSTALYRDYIEPI